MGARGWGQGALLGAGVRGKGHGVGNARFQTPFFLPLPPAPYPLPPRCYPPPPSVVLYHNTDTVDPVFTQLDPRSPTPMYAQIAGRMRLAIAAGELAEGDALPSVRSLATTLRVNPATVVQAYRELEREGVVDVRQGAGTFVAALSTERRARTREQEARRLVRTLVEQAARLSISPSDIRRALDAELGGIHA